jgi:hypothetical protein
VSIWWTLYYGYLWPSLKGNGPEAIAQTVLYGAIAVLVVPAARAFITRHVGDLHDKLDHIILHHPDIPDYVDKRNQTPVA